MIGDLELNWHCHNLTWLRLELRFGSMEFNTHKKQLSSLLARYIYKYIKLIQMSFHTLFIGDD